MIDFPLAVKGASAGFSILLIGGLMSPLIAVVEPVAGSVALVATAVLAFYVAARRIGVAAVPELHGAVAAAVAYVLVLPLVLRSEAGRNLPQILFTTAAALAVGAATGWWQARRAA